MNIYNATTRWACLTIATALLAGGSPARAGDAGHYVGGLMDTRDYFVPDPGFYAALYNYFYTSDRYNDASGQKVQSISINRGPAAGTTLDASINLNMYVLVPAVIWVSPWDILGAKYAAYIAPTFANASIQNAVYNSRGLGVTGSSATFAPGDLFVQPLWLGWTRPHWDFAAGYGFYAPVGKYNTATLPGNLVVPASDNIGMGFWTQQAQGAAAWYPWTNHATAVTVVMTYEYNTPQQGTDVKYGQNLWLNWGISQYLPLTRDEKLLLEIGPAGYYEWQISDTQGSLTESPGARTRVGAIGGQLGLTYVPWDLVLNFRGFYEYYADDRVQGGTFSVNLVKKF